VERGIGEPRMARDPETRIGGKALAACENVAGGCYSGTVRRHGPCPFFLQWSAIENGRDRATPQLSVASFLITLAFKPAADVPAPAA